MWETVKQTCERCSIPMAVRLKRVKKQAKTLNDSIVTSTLGQRGEVDGKDAFRRQIYLPIIDQLISEMEKRFSKANINIMKGIQGLNQT